LRLIQTTDFFYPLVDDPYMQGRITCANVLSDLYAMGCTDCDNMLMLLGVAVSMQEPVKSLATRLVMKGFHDAAREAETRVTGGQTVKSEWFLMGGVATSVVHQDKVVAMNQAEPGDILVLTKPLGTQVAVNAHRWLNKEAWKRVEQIVTMDQVESMYATAVASMARLNRNAAHLMLQHGKT
jgi:selenide,water dikinase